MPQAVKLKLFLDTDHSISCTKIKILKIKIKKQINKAFENVGDYFVENKSCIHFGDYKTKSILFASKRKIKSAMKLNLTFKNMKIKQCLQVAYLGHALHETLSWDIIALKVLSKISRKPKFLYHENKSLI